MIFSHVLYQLSYLAVCTVYARKGVGEGDSRLRDARYQGMERPEVAPGRLVTFGLLPREAVEFEGGLEHLLWEGSNDGLGLLAGLEESDSRYAGDAEGTG